MARSRARNSLLRIEEPVLGKAHLTPAGVPVRFQIIWFNALREVISDAIRVYSTADSVEESAEFI